MTEETKSSSETTVRGIRCGSHKKLPEKKVWVVLEGLLGGDTIAESCR